MNKILMNQWVHAGVFLGAPLLVGCTENLVVGSERDDIAEVSERERFVSQPVAVVASDSCAESDTARFESRNEWFAQSNSLGELVSTLWRGNIDLGLDMELAVATDGSAYVTFGDGTLLPRPTDPEAGWGCEESDSLAPETLACGAGTHAGLEYIVRGAQFDGKRLQMNLQMHQPWDEWCSLQEPQKYPDLECLYNAHPYAGTGPGPGDVSCGYYWDDSSVTPVDCLVMDLREYVCVCTESRCMANIASHEINAISFDFRLSEDGKTLEGSTTHYDGESSRVQLYRAE